MGMIEEFLEIVILRKTEDKDVQSGTSEFFDFLHGKWRKEKRKCRVTGVCREGLQ